MKNLAWQRSLMRLVGYGSSYLLTCGILFPVWALFMATSTVPPLWQQIILAVVLPFGLLIKLPANTWAGIASCMVLNTLLWAVLMLIVRERTIYKRQQNQLNELNE